jgi:YlmC/YmxH family sporulation protein
MTFEEKDWTAKKQAFAAYTDSKRPISRAEYRLERSIRTVKRFSTADLRRLEIVNLCDGTRLGYATDFEFDCEDARILALVIRGSCGLFGFGQEDDLVIPWNAIQCIGEDAILVKLTSTELSCCLCHPYRKGKRSRF